MERVLSAMQENPEALFLESLSRSIAESRNLDSLLHTLCARIGHFFDVQVCGIALGESPDRLQLKAYAGQRAHVGAHWQNASFQSQSLLAQSFITQRSILIDNLGNDIRVTQSFYKGFVDSACLILPLNVYDASVASEHLEEIEFSSSSDTSPSNQNGYSQTLGAMFVIFAPHHKPQEVEKKLLETVGVFIAQLAQKALLMEHQRHILRQLTQLDRLSMLISNTSELENLWPKILHRLHTLTEAERIVIALDPSATNKFSERDIVSSEDVAQQEHMIPDVLMPFYTLDAGLVHKGGIPIPLHSTMMHLHQNDIRPHYWYHDAVARHELSPPTSFFTKPLSGASYTYENGFTMQGISQVISVPLSHHHRSWGVLWLGFSARSTLTHLDQNILMMAGAHIAHGFKNAEIWQQHQENLRQLELIQQQSIHDVRTRAVGLVAHGVAHDFNNILSTISGRCQLLQRLSLDAETLRHVQAIAAAANNGVSLVQRIGKLGIDGEEEIQKDTMDPVDICALVYEMKSDFDAHIFLLNEKRLNNQRIQLCYNVPTTPLWIRGEPIELKEVLSNLVNNSIDSMAHGGRCDVRVIDENMMMCLQVQDQGTGIPQEYLNRIFEPYFTTKGERGTGLGLSVSAAILKRHDADVTVESQTSGVERGTLFTIRFPKMAAPITHSVPVKNQLEVLVVDDEGNVQELLKDVLESMNVFVHQAHDGAEALHLLRENAQIKAILTDYTLPGFNGIELAEKALALKPTLKTALITGWNSADIQWTNTPQEKVLVIAKPFKIDEIQRFIDKIKG
jgi:signal transduction histidine kinase